MREKIRKNQKKKKKKEKETLSLTLNFPSSKSDLWSISLISLTIPAHPLHLSKMKKLSWFSFFFALALFPPPLPACFSHLFLVCVSVCVCIGVCVCRCVTFPPPVSSWLRRSLPVTSGGAFLNDLTFSSSFSLAAGTTCDGFLIRWATYRSTPATLPTPISYSSSAAKHFTTTTVYGERSAP